MFFLIRTAFWISLLLLVLPFGGEPASDGVSAGDKASIDTLSALAAAGATVQDFGGFCSRQPDACSVGGEALKRVGERARDGAAALHEYLSKDGATEAPKAAPVSTRSAQPTATGSTSAARQTLTPTDRKPAWRKPAA